MGKEFQRKYMHPTRRKLVDMIQTGEYDKNTQVGWTKSKEVHNVGDIWEDEYYRYEQKEGYVVKTGKNHEALQEIRKYLSEKKQCTNPSCKKHKKTQTDFKLIQKTGYCVDCLADIEHNFRVAGIWKEYEDFKIYTRMIVEGKIKLDELKHSITELKPYYEFVNEDGTIEKWSLPKPIDEIQKDIEEMIENGEKEIQDIVKKRNEAFEVITQHNLEHYL
jgi:L-fucose mutarotase/ribose pyranase (RbsD/FucU family)